MTIRFTEREKFRDKWYRSLTPVQKCIWEYLISECDHAGLLELDIKMMSFQIGTEITIDQVKVFEKIGKIKFLNNDIVFIPKFVLFQQRLERLDQLNPKNRCHKSILDRLKKFGISPLGSPLEGPKKDLLRTYSNSNSNSNSKDIYCNKDFDKCFDIYSEICKKLIPIKFERRSKAILELLRDFLEEIDYDFDYFKELCQKANILEKIMETKIDFKMLLKNHAGIMSGKYNKVIKTANDYKY